VKRTALALLALLAPTLAGCGKRSGGAAQAEPVKVAAAADLSFAFKDVGDVYEKATGHKVVFSFGSTGLLEKQIAEGAPFDVFAAANVSFADDAARSGACDAQSEGLYAVGRIVMYSVEGATFVPKALADLGDARVSKIAIANPDHAPYGKAARQAMEKAGVWDAVHAKVVYGENVQQTLQFAQSGNAEVAIVALSLATVTPGHATEIPAGLYDRIDQALIVCRNGKAGTAAGKTFVDFVKSEQGHAIMKRYGFLLPGESMATATAVP
jgi:molybdate transport system substrate-binding protein